MPLLWFSQLSKTAKGQDDTARTIAKGEKTVKRSRLMLPVDLGIKRETEATVTADGPREEEAFTALLSFLQENL